nr:hypothetical protein [Desulfofarcimen acetoxidans]
MDLQPILEQLAKLPPEILMKIMPELKVEVPKANPSGAVLIGRNDIEISFRFLKGSLDLQQVFLRNPERVDAYCFLKVLAMLVLNLAAWLLAKNGKKMSPQKL